MSPAGGVIIFQGIILLGNLNSIVDSNWGALLHLNNDRETQGQILESI